MVKVSGFGKVVPASLDTCRGIFVAAAILLPLGLSAAHAEALNYAALPQNSWSSEQLSSPQIADEDADGVAVPERFKRQVVSFHSREPVGTVVIDTGNTYLYYVLGDGRAVRYGIGVGREGFTWSGVQTVSRKAQWPDWTPPQEMIARQPYLPRFMAGGPGNPLGAAAMYLGSTIYRIHGTNAPSTIGKFVSSGCIRLTNEDVADLASRVEVGTKVVVMPKNAPLQANVSDAAPLRVSTTQRSSHNVKLSGLY